MTSFLNESGEYLDYPDTIGITKQCANFFAFQIKGDVSVSVKFDNNSVTRKFLGLYGTQQVDAPSRIAVSKLDDGNVVSKGYLVIQGEGEKDISCFYISGNSNWFQSFQFNLKDITFPDLMTVLWSDVNGRKAATSGIVFPLVDWWGSGARRSPYLKLPDVANNVDSVSNLKDVHPCLYLHSLVSYMGVAADVNISGDLMTDALYKKIIITNDGPDYSIPDSMVERTFIRIQNGPFGTPAEGIYDSTLDPQPIRFNTIIAGQGQLTNYSVYAPLTGTYRLDLDIWVSIVDTYGIFIYVNDALYTSLGTLTLTTRNYVGTAFVNLRKGDKLTFYIQNTLAGDYRLDFQLKRTNIGVSLEKVGGVRPAGNVSSYSPVDTVAYVIPNSVVPDMKAVDLVKFLTFFFGCVVSYDEQSRTININKLSNFKKENAKNWSNYFVGAQTDYKTGVARLNYIQAAEGTERDIVAYNEQSNVSYGGGTIETSLDAKEENELYEIPFCGSWDTRNKSYLKQFFPYINFYDIEYGQSVAYSGVTSSGGFAQFTCTFNEPMSDGDVFWVISSGGFYSGFSPVYSAGPVTNPILLLDYIANDTGTIVRCTPSKVTGVPRMLICNAGMNLSDAGGSSATVYLGTSAGTAMTTGCIAWFDKPKVIAPIDSYRESLAINSINGEKDISERYLWPVETIFNNPVVKAEFLLPLSVFQGFDFGSYIYIETKELTGYFLVQKIENYKDSLTPVKVELLYADG